jgi:uncharacterized protein (DUF2147 family)
MLSLKPTNTDMNNYRKQLIATLGLVWALFLFQNARAQTNTDDILGTWLVEKKDGKVEIYKQGNQYFGKIVWLQEPNGKDGKPVLDKNNPEASKRSQPIVGLVMLKNLQWKGKGNWEDGNVYDPHNGKTYNASVKMKDKASLEFTGFVGMAFIGRTEVWTRVK